MNEAALQANRFCASGLAVYPKLDPLTALDLTLVEKCQKSSRFEQCHYFLQEAPDLQLQA